jgi:hypothetical protein
MAKLLCQVHWDNNSKKVITSYEVLRVEPQDAIHVTTEDDEPFIIQAKDARSERIVERLKLPKAKNADGNDLYQVPKATAAEPKPADTGTPLDCGTLNKQGQFVSWGPGLPLDD